MSCFVQTCDQIITGRQFGYDRALEIVQDEQYLEDVDFDEIRRYDILKKIGEFNPNFNIPESRQKIQWQQGHHQRRPQKYKNNHGRKDDSNVKNLPEGNKLRKRNNRPTYAYKKQFDAKLADKYPLYKTRSKRSEPAFDFTLADFCAYIAASGAEIISDGEARDSGSSLCGSSGASGASFGSSFGSSPASQVFQSVGGQAAGALGAGMAGMLGTAMMTNLDFSQGGQAGVGAAGAGAGGLPTDTSILTLGLSLILVPLGLTAVAVFPPFETPRTFPAVGVIFREARDMTGTIRKRDVRRLKREIKKRGYKFWIGDTTVQLPSYREIMSSLEHALTNAQTRKIGLLTQVWNHLSRFRVWIAKKMYKRLSRPMQKIVKKIGRLEARIHKKMICLRPRLQRRYGRLVYPEGLTIKAIKNKEKSFLDFINNGNAEDEHVEYVEDCFADMERPKFGWRVKVTFMEDEPCNLNLENPELSTCILTSNPDNDLNNSDGINFFQGNTVAQSRQTGESFRSAAPADCRYRYVCDADNPAPGNTGPENIAQTNNDQLNLATFETNPVQLPTQEIPVPVVQDTRTVPIQENPIAGLDALALQPPNPEETNIFQPSQVQPISEIPQPQPQDQILPDFQGNPPVQIETAPEAPNQVLGPQDFYSSFRQPLDPYKHYPYTTLHRNN